MSETRTASILQRVPVILAVTAASYGLTLQNRPVTGADAQRTTATQGVKTTGQTPGPRR